MTRTLLLLPLFACNLDSLIAEEPNETSDGPVPCEERAYFLDVDGDGFTGSVEPVFACEAPEFHITDPYDHDCDDTDPRVNAAAVEICNGEDTNCNGEIDDGVEVVAYFLDEDGDGVGGEVMVESCRPLEGAYVVETGDCDDTDPSVSPVADELCDGLDQDCDGWPDNDPVDGNVYFWDRDADGFGDAHSEFRICEEMDEPGLIDVGEDCDDDDPSINPLGEESCNGLDDDCNGVFDDGLQTGMFWYDSDGDGFGDPGTVGVMACIAPEEYVPNDDDCDIWDGFVNPGAIELCNGIDDDCDGTTTDEEEDLDGDGFSVCSGDCDDTAAEAAPGGAEICDGVDNDCDGVVNNAWIDEYEPNNERADAPLVLGDNASITLQGTISGPDDTSDWYAMDTVDDPDNFFNGDAFHASFTVSDLPPGVEARLHMYRINMVNQVRHVMVDESWEDGNLHVERGGVWLSNDSNRYWAHLEILSGYDCEASYSVLLSNGG